MGAGASVLQGGANNVECKGGAYGYTIDFPPGHFDSSSSQQSDFDYSITMEDAFEGLY